MRIFSLSWCCALAHKERGRKPAPLYDVHLSLDRGADETSIRSSVHAETPTEQTSIEINEVKKVISRNVAIKRRGRREKIMGRSRVM